MYILYAHLFIYINSLFLNLEKKKKNLARSFI